LPRDITAPSTNNQLVSIIYLSPVANLFLKFRIFSTDLFFEGKNKRLSIMKSLYSLIQLFKYQ
ncbi:hypothetical protein LMB76_06995, partial [Limosilactobacillus reuteri]